MANTQSIVTVSDEAISDEISSEVAAEILTKQIKRRDPQELLKIVLAVHTTLRELSDRARQGRYRRIMRASDG